MCDTKEVRTVINAAIELLIHLYLRGYCKSFECLGKWHYQMTCVLCDAESFQLDYSSEL